ncbi:MAG: hypothetical protein U5K75_00235 [Ahrensia sp.]|nr:hypothetical protein [Ahrensia sp.]
MTNTDVAEYVSIRQIEAIVALYFFLNGVLLILEETSSIAVFGVFDYPFRQQVWGWLMFIGGVISFSALWLNGRNPIVSRKLRISALAIQFYVCISVISYFYTHASYFLLVLYGILLPMLLIIIMRRVMFQVVQLQKRQTINA